MHMGMGHENETNCSRNNKNLIASQAEEGKEHKFQYRSMGNEFLILKAPKISIETLRLEKKAATIKL